MPATLNAPIKPDVVGIATSRFAMETAGHVAKVIHADGLYRHIRFAPATGGGFYWIDFHTAPGLLTIRGDMGTFVFRSDEEDILGLFARIGTPDLRHLSESRLVAADRVDGWRGFSEDMFAYRVIDHVVATTQHLTRSEQEAILHDVRKHVIDSDSHHIVTAEIADLAVSEYPDHAETSWRFGSSFSRDYDDWSFRFAYNAVAAVRFSVVYEQGAMTAVAAE